MKSISIKELKQRKFMLLLPGLVLPFLTIIFWALGGGKADGATSSGPIKEGFNVNLPGAKQGLSHSRDKMSYYDKAQADTMKMRGLRKIDPNYQFDTTLQTVRAEQYGINRSVYGQGYSGSASAEIYGKLSELDRAMKDDYSDNYSGSNYRNTPSSLNDNGEIDRLEQMMVSMNQATQGGDPEMEQLNGMLEKIMTLQHPELAKEQLQQLKDAKRGRVYPVSKPAINQSATLLEDSQQGGEDESGFFGAGTDNVQEFQNAIQAVVHETQTLVNGSTIKLRLLNDVVVNGKTIPKNSFIYGQVNLKGERLQITLSSIRNQHSLYPVDLTVFDVDGLDGIRIPDAISRKVAKEGADQSLQGIDMGTINSSWGSQAADAGIEVVKNFLGKKTKLIKVTVKAGYKILLRDNQVANDPADLIKF